MKLVKSDKRSSYSIVVIVLITLAVFIFLIFFLRPDLFPKNSISSSGSRSIGIQALSAFTTTVGTIILLFLNLRSDQRAKNSEMISSQSISQTNAMIAEVSRLSAMSERQANALSNQNDLLKSRDVLRSRYSLIPIISKDFQGVFESVQLINMSSSSLLILSFKRDGKDCVGELISINSRSGSNYIILDSNDAITILDKNKFSGSVGDIYHFSIGIHYEKLNDRIQNTSFSLLIGVNGTATIEEFSDTNPSRPVESVVENPDGSLKRVIAS